MNDTLVSYIDLTAHAKSLGLDAPHFTEPAIGELAMRTSIPKTFWAVITGKRSRLERKWNRELKQRTPVTAIVTGKVDWQ